MNKERILEALNKIKARTYKGSSICDGWVYHTLPFEDLPKMQSHRGYTFERWKHIQEKSGVNFENKTLIDLGCSVGAFSIFTTKAGAIVTGYDYDPDSLKVAQIISEEMDLSILFNQSVIDINFLKKLPRVDIILWLSQWMWFVKQHGLEEGKDALFEIGKHSNTLLFESAANDAAAKIPGTTQETIAEWLEECTAYSQIIDIGTAGGWHGNRHVFVCHKPEYLFKGNRTQRIERISRGIIRKTYMPSDEWMIAREEECLRRLENYNHFPKFLGKTERTIDISYCGRISPFGHLSDQKKEIINALKACGITHRDIKPPNILRLKNIMYLIDFGWALLDSEEDTPSPAPPTLGGVRYKDNKWNDAKVMEEL